MICRKIIIQRKDKTFNEQKSVKIVIKKKKICGKVLTLCGSAGYLLNSFPTGGISAKNDTTKHSL